MEAAYTSSKKKSIRARAATMDIPAPKKEFVRPKHPQIFNCPAIQLRTEWRATCGDGQSEICCTKIEPKDRLVACGTADGMLNLYNFFTGKLLYEIKASTFVKGIFNEMPITSVKWKPIKSSDPEAMPTLLTTHADGYFKQWQV